MDGPATSTAETSPVGTAQEADRDPAGVSAAVSVPEEIADAPLVEPKGPLSGVNRDRVRRLRRRAGWAWLRVWARSGSLVRGLVRGRARFRVRGLVLAGALSLVGLASVGILAGYLVAGARPGWWGPMDPGDPVNIANAKRIHVALTNQLNARRDAAENLSDAERFRSAPWGMRLAVDDANAWLNIEMPRWLRSSGGRLPTAWLDEIDQIRVDFDGKEIRAGVEAPTDEGERWLWVTVEPRIDEDGSLWMLASTVHIGRLAMPARWVLDRAEHDLDTGETSVLPAAIARLPEARELISALRGERPLAVDPVIRLFDGGRQVRLLELKPEDGRLLIVCQTEGR